MSLVQDNFVPQGDQQVVRFLKESANKLILVEGYEGPEFLVSLPQQYREVTGLTRGDCLVVQPIQLEQQLDQLTFESGLEIFNERGGIGCERELDPVKGTVLCLMSRESVLKLINSGEYPGNPTQLSLDQRFKLKTFFQEWNGGQDEGKEEGFRSRVQFVTSGVVTVTNVMSSIGHGIQSLDFENEDSCEEPSSPPLMKRQANTIRIQVNYPP